jgi:copper chaperone NosL
MKQLPRILMFSAALSLLALFVFPMWKIQLFAPQYPGGVEMHIWINKISGTSPGTLQNVNILNHYIGMQKIDPDSIPELQYLKYIILGLMALGLIAGAVNKRSLFLIWTVLLVLLCVVGLYDFYLWEYDYGHNLSDTAPIKIPDASFQPPVLGSKEILNFTAVSLPHIGGYFVMLSIVLGAAAWVIKRKFYQNEKAIVRASGPAVAATLHA